MIPTGQDAADVRGGIPLIKGGALPALNGPTGWRNPVITGLGWSFEGEEIACMGPNANINFGSTFSTHLWIYPYELYDWQTVWCKEWLEDETDIKKNSLRYCLYIINAQYVIVWNPSNVTTHRQNYLLYDGFNYQYLKTDLYVKEGWTYVALNFQTNATTNTTDIWGYAGYADQCTTVSSVYTLAGGLIDDNKFIWCLGNTVIHNQVTLKYERRFGLKALVNNWALLRSKLIYRWQAFDYFGFQCHDYCRICRAVDQPKCLEDFESNLLHFWDFGPFRWYRPIFDYGRISSTIPLNNPMLDQALFVHNNGMWFDGVMWITPNTKAWSVFTWTVDVWFKFYNICNGTLIENNSTFPKQWSLWFYPPNNVTFQINMNTINTTFSYTPSTDKNKWMIVQAGTNKQDKESKICIKMNEDPRHCNMVATYYDDTGGAGNLRIGYGFNGYIRKIKIYDWFKTDQSMKIMYKTTPQCYKFHWTQPDCHICDVDYNFTCYTSCSEINQWDYDCKTCHWRCRTCSGNDEFHCFSCNYPRYDFNELGTCCPEQCGDGWLLGDYQCDDGNTRSNDGCSSNCQYEAGFQCIAGTPTSSTSCYEICGDGRRINHQCDDGNTINGDGCNSTCYVEYGYTCTGGARDNIDVCWEKCGDGITLIGTTYPSLNNYQCDDGNNNNGDGCSSTCKIETGWTCSGGNETNASKCTEICGDGIRTYAACDDANTNNGDGCSSTCAVESGWKCGTEVPSICWKITQPSIVNTTLEKALIGLTFNESVILDQNWSKTDWSLNVSGPLTPYNLTWEFISAPILMVPIENLSVWFSYEIDNRQVFGFGTEQLIINFDNLTVMNSYSYHFGIINQTVSFNLYPYESSDDCGIGSIGTAIISISSGIVILGLIGLLVKHSMVVSWQIIGLLQFLNFVPLMMIYNPSCIVSFCESFAIFNSQIGAIASTLIRGLFTYDHYTNTVDYKFSRSGYTSTAFLWNAADIICIWIICGLIVPILYFATLIFTKYEIIHTIEYRYKKGFPYVLILLTYLRGTFCVALNLAHAEFNNPISSLSTCLALIYACVIVAYPPYEAYNAFVYRKEIKKGTRPTYLRLNILFYDFGVMNPFQFFYYWQFFLRRFIFAIMLLAWPQQKYLTLSCCTLMHMCSMLYVTYVKPFNSITRNFSVILTETGLVALHGTLFGFIDAPNGLGNQHFVDYALIFAVILLVVVCGNLVLECIDFMIPLYKLGVILNIIEEKAPDPAANRMIDEISASSDNSLTEKNITIGSNDMGEYGPEGKDREYIEINDPKKEEKMKKLKDMRPKTPPKTDQPLVSNFGPKSIPLSTPKDTNMMKTATGINPTSIMKTPITAKEPSKLLQTLDNIQATSLDIDPRDSLQIKTPKDYNSDIPKGDSSEIPKEGKILTPNLEGGFAGGEFANALKEAKETDHYNFIKY